ncbi:MAG: DUF58 domain-containing protein [Acidobacteriota bacterium]
MLTGAETAQLDRLALGSAAAAPAASVAGLRHARARGYGLETTDHRPYRPGDDPRQIDWNADARLRQLTVRVLQAEGQAHVHVVVDTSASMTHTLAYAAKLAAALAYLTVARRDLAGISLFSDTVTTHLPATRGRAHLHQLFGALDGATPSGGSHITPVLTEISQRLRPPAFVVVLSDFFTPGFGLDGLRALSARGLDPAVLQIVSDNDLEPQIADGDTVIDREIAGSARADLAAYRERFALMTSELRHHCLAHGMPWLQLRPSTGFAPALDAMIHAGILAGRR